MTYLDKLVDYIIRTPNNTNAAVVKSLAERYTEEKAGGGNNTLNKLISREITEITSNITEIGDSAFSQCLNLTTANFPLATLIQFYAFTNCSSLTTINFPLVTSVGLGAFSNCKSLITADFPNATSIGAYAFQGCENLTTVDFPLATSIEYSAFEGCSNLTTINLPLVTSVEESAFSSCSKLTAINLPLVTSIGGTFRDCSNLTIADFPSVTSIGSYSFYNCSSLTALILKSETMAALLYTDAFIQCYHFHGTVNSTYNPEGLKDGYIYVPRSLVDSYKTANNWSTFATQFRALEDYTVDGTITGELDPDKI